MKLCSSCTTWRNALNRAEDFDTLTTCEVIAEKGRYYSDATAGHARFVESQERKRKDKIKKYTKRGAIYVGCFVVGALVVYGLNKFFAHVQ